MENRPDLFIDNSLVIVSSKKGERLNGLVVHAVFEVSIGVPAVVIAVNQNNLTYDYIRESGAFTVSVLEKDTPLPLIGLFGFKSGREVDKFKNVDYATGKSGLPYLLTNCLGYLECRVVQTFNLAALTLFAGKVTGSAILKEGAPLSTHHYRKVMKGKFPKTSSLYGQGGLYFG
ncbi:MAG: flavin reductase family protein [Armatimonadetes bacterium]|nr:flavin reductase family protein [Armatimonadota bacterium]